MFGGGTSSNYVFVTDEEFAFLMHTRNESRDAQQQQAPAWCIRPVARNESSDAPRNELQHGAFVRSRATSPVMHAHHVPCDAHPLYDAYPPLPVARSAQVPRDAHPPLPVARSAQVPRDAHPPLPVARSVQVARNAPPRYEACQPLPVARNDIVYENPHAEILYALAVKQFQEQEELRVQQETELDEATHAYFDWHAHTFGQSRACIDTAEILKQALQMAPEQAEQARRAEQAEQVVRDEQFARALSLRD
jgi:hypothetical protein